MTDFKVFLSNIINNNPDNYKADYGRIMTVLVNNDWFGIKPICKDRSVYLDDSQIEILENKLTLYLNDSENYKALLHSLSSHYPETARTLEAFFADAQIDHEVRLYVSDFLLHSLTKDIFLYTDIEIEALLRLATDEMIKVHGDCLTFYLAWLRIKMKTHYHKDYEMSKRYTMDIQNEAYDFDEYLELIYKLFCEEYIQDNDMYRQAAMSVNFTDTWLYLAMHCISSVRDPDLERIPRPKLPYPPLECIEKVKNDEFSDNDARLVLLSITQNLCVMPLLPNKTSRVSGVTSIKIFFPTSSEKLFGTLFALAEAHRLLKGDIDSPIIRKISGYKDILRYMGDDIGDLFLESDFRSKSATKSYLQAIYMNTDNVLDEHEVGPAFKGYLLTSLARSHKGSFGEFARTTATYLKDAKFNGLTPEIVAFELFERGIMSFVCSELLDMVTSRQYSALSVSKQTALVKSLGLSPHEIESLVAIIDTAQQKAKNAISEVVSSGCDILTVLHRIASGQAFSYRDESQCLLSAIGKTCVFEKRRPCVGCKYEISTRATFFELITEYNRMKTIYDNGTDDLEKDKCKHFINTIIVPSLDLMLFSIRKDYGDETFEQYSSLIKEYISK